MKKSLLNVITLSLVLINLVLTVLLTFSLVSTSRKTDNLITKIAGLIDLDIADSSDKENNTDGNSTVDIDNLEIIDLKNSDDTTKITVSIRDANGKIHYAVAEVVLSLNKKSKDYSTKRTSVDNAMKLFINDVNTTISNYTYENADSNKSVIEKELLKKFQDRLQSDIIYNVSFVSFVIG